MLETIAPESKPTFTGQFFLIWALRLVVAAMFLYAGVDKVMGGRVWVRIFDGIGVGRWFRFVTAALQITGAILVLVPRAPRAFLAGIGILACTMIGACIAWLTVLHAPINIVVPGILLMLLLIVGVYVWSSDAV